MAIGRWVLLAFACVVARGAAHAAEQPLLGRVFSLRARSGDVRDRRVVVRAAEHGGGAALAGDPLVDGATLTLQLFDAAGIMLQAQTFTVPPGGRTGGAGWAVRRSARHPERGAFTYTDDAGRNGAVARLRLVRTRRALRLQVRLSGKRASEEIALVPPDAGAGAAVLVSIGAADRYCATFGLAAGGELVARNATSFRIRKAYTALCPAPPSDALGAFVPFESGPVRPLALSPDGTRLFVVNTPAARLDVFALDEAGDATPLASVPVGLEPVAVAARSADEAWVVNHLSDSVSVVRLDAPAPRVVATLLVGDEPRDVVFAGTGATRAFVTAAHRGQNSGVAADDLVTPGVGRADVWVFDADAPGPALGGTPLAVVALFGDTPRALAVSPDGATVYAAVFASGNQTTSISEGLVCNGGAAAGPCTIAGTTVPGGLPAPNPVNCAGEPQPETGLIVRYDGAAGAWRDATGRDWSAAVRFSLPDQDVFAIGADGTPPAPIGVPWSGVGTVLFDMVANPVSGKVYVSNTEARNEVRFEGPGTCSTTVQGRLHQARITVLDGTSVLPRHLNKHIDYDVRPAPASVRAASLATPLGMAVTPDGATLYVAAFGSGVVGVLSTAMLEQDTFVPDASDHIAVTGGGPSGLVLRGERLYVATRFDDGLSVIDTTTRTEIAHHLLYDPEPASVRAGRPVLYDAAATSSNGEASCASCHVFGDMDGLAWDLGDPDAVQAPNPNPILLPDPFGAAFTDFAALKGPMTTQSLRGLANHGPMHWRGDRTGGSEPDGDPLDEAAAFGKFLVAFAGLLGHDGPIADADMEAFGRFILQVPYPPNPVRALDGSLAPAEAAGRNLFFGRISDVVFNCNGCHVLDPARGFFGSDGSTTFEGETQLFKVAHLRNAYQKVGMFGMAAVPGVKPGDNGFMGPQVRGFGFTHDGSVDTLTRFHRAGVFDLTLDEARDMTRFMLAFDTTLAPIVGQQVTLDAANAATVGPRIDLLIARARTPFVLAGHPEARECDLVVKGVLDGVPRSWLLRDDGTFASDRAGEGALADAALRAQAGVGGQERTYTCVPPGSGERMGLDADGDGCRDGDDPAPEDAAVGCGT